MEGSKSREVAKGSAVANEDVGLLPLMLLPLVLLLRAVTVFACSLVVMASIPVLSVATFLSYLYTKFKYSDKQGDWKKSRGIDFKPERIFALDDAFDLIIKRWSLCDAEDSNAKDIVRNLTRNPLHALLAIRGSRRDEAIGSGVAASGEDCMNTKVKIADIRGAKLIWDVWAVAFMNIVHAVKDVLLVSIFIAGALIAAVPVLVFILATLSSRSLSVFFDAVVGHKDENKIEQRGNERQCRSEQQYRREARAE